MKLIDWMRDHRMNDSALAELLGNCSQHAVKKWKYGERKPPVEVIVRIEEITRKKVTLRDFVDAT